MQLPFAKLLGLASGAVGLVQKAFTNNSGNGDFDAELTEALTGKTTSDKKGLMKMLSGKGILDEDVLEGLMGCSSGMALFQFMAELKKIGINPGDMKFLLGGDASKVSDDALKDLLTSFGFGKAELEKVLSDTNLKTRIKESLAESLKEVFQTQARQEGLDPEVMVKLATADAATVEKFIETAKTSLNNSAVLENAPMSSSQAAAEIREMIAKALKISGDGSSTGQVTSKASAASTASSVENMIQVAQKSFDIRRETLNELFFATDENTREEATAQVTRQINKYLSSHSGQQMDPKDVEALTLIKSAMSEKEFSGIDNSLKLWKPGLVIADVKAEMSRNLYESLAKQLSSEGSAALYEKQVKQVMDQLRRALPSHMKNSEGNVTLKLHPPMLGRVDVNMSMNDGQLQAAFKTDQALTRDILLQNMHVLRDSLAEQGIRATNFTVTSGLDGKPSNDGYAFAGQDRQDHGFGHNGRRSGTGGRAFKDDKESVYSRSTAQDSAAGGLDIFA